MGPPGGSQTPGGLQTHSRLTFGGITTKEKMVKNGGYTPGVHLDSARVQVESNQNMWRSVKSSQFSAITSFSSENWLHEWLGLGL
jgi:hypothetical protein